MEKTQENAKFCADLVQNFMIFKRLRPEDEHMKLAVGLLVKTFLEACKSHESAQAVADAILSEEESFPVPATIRKWLRELNYIEEDKAKKYWDEVKREG